ncbi:hypothetical protein [Niallia sp. Krafla_26]
MNQHHFATYSDLIKNIKREGLKKSYLTVNDLESYDMTSTFDVD